MNPSGFLLPQNWDLLGWLMVEMASLLEGRVFQTLEKWACFSLELLHLSCSFPRICLLGLRYSRTEVQGMQASLGPGLVLSSSSQTEVAACQHPCGTSFPINVPSWQKTKQSLHANSFKVHQGWEGASQNRWTNIGLIQGTPCSCPGISYLDAQTILLAF